MTRLGFISDPGMIAHAPSKAAPDERGGFGENGHPERPDRLRAVHRAVRQAGFLTSLDPFPDFEMTFAPLIHAERPAIELPYRVATDEDLRLCHPQSHIDRVAKHCLAAEPLDEDTPVGKLSDRCARAAVGMAISAVDAVLAEQVDRCFVVVRPPGHHAEPGKAMGFCLYSTVAIAARHAVVRRGLKRVAIFDFDVHHGNGTQACLAGDPNVLFVSTHQSPETCYPGTGFARERGTGAGEGLTLNLPLEPGTDGSAYEQVLLEKVAPAMEAFGPELILLSAGYDGHAEDPLANLNLSDETYSTIAAVMTRLAKQLCGGRMVAVMEGGYDLGVLGRCAVRTMVEMGQ